MSNRFIKTVGDVLSEYLAYLINLSFEKECFPNCLKIAKVIPLYKSGDKESFNNYRPISLLSTLSKVFERTIHTRIVNFFNIFDLWYSKQYEFRRSRNCVDAIIDLMEKISLVKKQCDAVFLDMTKAFDMVDTTILLKKLHHYGIRGQFLSLLESYLTNRK